MKTGSYEAFISNCQETMVGVYLTDGVTDRIQCTMGHQVRPLLDKRYQHPKETDTYVQNVMLAQVAESDTAVNTNLADVSSETSPKGDYTTIPEDERKRMADLINSDPDLTYWARSYTEDEDF